MEVYVMQFQKTHSKSVWDTVITYMWSLFTGADLAITSLNYLLVMLASSAKLKKQGSHTEHISAD